MIAAIQPRNKIASDPDLQSLDMTKLAIWTAKNRDRTACLPRLARSELRVIARTVRQLAWFLTCPVEGSHEPTLPQVFAVANIRDFCDAVIVRHCGPGSTAERMEAEVPA